MVDTIIYGGVEGENFKLRDDTWYMNGLPLDNAVFCSGKGYALTKELLENNRITPKELFSFGNDPLTEKGVLFYTTVNSGKLKHSSVLTIAVKTIENQVEEESLIKLAGLDK